MSGTHLNLLQGVGELDKYATSEQVKKEVQRQMLEEQLALQKRHAIER